MNAQPFAEHLRTRVAPAPSPRLRPRRRPGLAWVACALLTPAGCYSYSPLTVAVRDRATRDPIAGAFVSVGNTSLLNPVKPEAAEGETNEQGEVALAPAAYNRLLIRVRVAGRADHLVNADHPRVFGASEWFCPITDEAGARASVEIRLTP